MLGHSVVHILYSSVHLVSLCRALSNFSARFISVWQHNCLLALLLSSFSFLTRMKLAIWLHWPLVCSSLIKKDRNRKLYISTALTKASQAAEPACSIGLCYFTKFASTVYGPLIFTSVSTRRFRDITLSYVRYLIGGQSVQSYTQLVAYSVYQRLTNSRSRIPNHFYQVHVHVGPLCSYSFSFSE